MIILEMKRKPDVRSVSLIQRTEKPKDRSRGKTKRYRFPIGAVELKKVNEDTKEIQCSKLKPKVSEELGLLTSNSPGLCLLFGIDSFTGFHRDGRL